MIPVMLKEASILSSIPEPPRAGDWSYRWLRGTPQPTPQDSGPDSSPCGRGCLLLPTTGCRSWPLGNPGQRASMNDQRLRKWWRPIKISGLTFFHLPWVKGFIDTIQDKGIPYPGIQPPVLSGVPSQIGESSLFIKLLQNGEERVVIKSVRFWNWSSA